jgi:hypothetical protein
MTQPFVLRWGIISTGRIASCFVKVRPKFLPVSFLFLMIERSRMLLLTQKRESDTLLSMFKSKPSDTMTLLKCSRDVTDVVHKITAVGSRSAESAQKFITEFAEGDQSIKAYGSYAGVFADPVSNRSSPRQQVS